MNTHILITNCGAEIEQTNYWETTMAKAGKLFCSVNAGAIRILVPPAMAEMIEDWNACEYVIISRGPWPEMGQPDGIELLFEDNGDSPFCLHLTPASFDLLPGDPGEKNWIVTAWLPGPEKVFEKRAKWRRVTAIPCLQPWERQ